MKILVLNSGSSSIKFQLFILGGEQTSSIASGFIEKIAENSSFQMIKYYLDEKEIKKEYKKKIETHKEGLLVVSEMLKSCSLLDDFTLLDGIGHRVVHGGELFSAATLIDDNSLESLKSISHLAPLHNPANITGIEVARDLAPNVPQIAIFDTSFHQSLPKRAYMYALPKEWYENHHVRRYGFHGTSHFFVAKESAKILGKEFYEINLITLHLGNGASGAAIKNGESIDTSMGLTPLEGFVMGSRCGDIDPAILPFMAKKLGCDVSEIENYLNKKSGLLGICGENDLREIIKRAEDGDKDASLALDIFCYRIKKYIGAYTVALGRVDAIVFTGGIGENSPLVRSKTCEGLEESIGAILDEERNRDGNFVEIAKKDSKIEILVVKTNEELEIAIQSSEIIKKVNKEFL